MTTIKNNILEIVEAKKIQMIPKWRFIFYTLLGIVGLLFSFLILFFVVSLIMFLLARYGFLYLPMFGFEATLHAITGIPILLCFLGVVLVGIIEVVSRQFSFSFRRPIIVTLCIIVGTAFVVGYAVSITPLHIMMRGYAKERHFERFSTLYERPFHDEWHEGRAVIRGEVIATSTDSLTLSLFNQMIRTVYATGTGASLTGLSLGDDIVIFGIIHDNRFEVMGWRFAPVMPFDENKPMRMMRLERGYDDGRMK